MNVGTGGWFPGSYEASRARFRQHHEQVRQLWPQASLRSQSLQAQQDLTIDWMQADPAGQPERLLIFTTAEHGIEGYVGAAILEVFFQEFLERLDPQTTGLLLVHCINPWGMQHGRRVNAQNVDLNRNFLWDAGEAANGERPFDPELNPAFRRIHGLLCPERPLGSRLGANLAFWGGVLNGVRALGPAGLREAALLGQYHTPQGICFGGTDYQEETRLLMKLYQEGMAPYPQVLHLDMHTGYGPRYQMSLVNSTHEPLASAELARRFDYPCVVKTNPDEFYRIQGDMIDYMYLMAGHTYPTKRLYATSFEFGTFGDSLAAALRSLRAAIWENQVRWHGATNAQVRAFAEREFRELFFPAEPGWRSKALADARRALAGILRAEGYWRGD
jgi:hypothetical protein